MNFLLLSFLLDHLPLTVETAFDLVVFILFLFLPGVCSHILHRGTANPVLSSHYTDSEALLYMSEFSKFPVIFSDGTSLVAF